MPNTVRLHRVLAAKPDKVYRAFTEPDAMAKWLPPNGFACTVHHLDAKVGGTFRMSFRNFTTGASHSFGGQYLELVPGQRLRYTDKFDDPNLPGEIQVTVALKPACEVDRRTAAGPLAQRPSPAWPPPSTPHGAPSRWRRGPGPPRPGRWPASGWDSRWCW